MRLHWDNLIDTATLSTDNGDPNYPLSSIQAIHLTEAFRFADMAGGYIDIDLGSAKAVSSIGIIGNLSASATITLKGNSSESWAAPPLDETITAADRNLIHYFTEATYRYWRLEIADSGNPDGYIEVSRVFLGTYAQLPGIRPEMSLAREDLSSREFSPTGQPFSVVRPKRISFNVDFPSIEEKDRESLLSAFNKNGIHYPMFIAVWEESFDVQEPVYGLFNENIEFNKAGSGVLWSASLSFIESR